MAVVYITAMIYTVAVLKTPMPISESHPAHDRSAQFEALLAEILRRRGWRVHSQSRMADRQNDLIANHGRKKYVIELKVSSEGRRDRIIPLASQAILEVQLAAQQSGKEIIPVAVIAGDHISDSVADQVKQFARDHAPNVGIGIMDASGFRSFLGHGLESLNAERSAASKVHVLAKSPSAANLFSDLNQWMLKVLLSGAISESLLSAPRGNCQNASQLASAAGVSAMSAFRLVRQLSEEGFLENNGVLRLVRIEELLERWLAANQSHGKEVPVRWIIRGERNQLQVAVKSCRLKSEGRRKRLAHGGHLSKAPARMCLGLFAAADALGLGFVHGAPQHLYLERLDADALHELGLSLENPDQKPDVYVRIPDNPEAVFRPAVEWDGVPVSDVLQVWLDVANHPSRGKAQADEIRKKVLSQLFKRGRA